MNTSNVVAALALVGGLWAAIVVVLARAVRRLDLDQDAPLRLLAKSAPWRSPPANRAVPEVARGTGPANVCTTLGIASAKDLSA